MFYIYIYIIKIYNTYFIYIYIYAQEKESMFSNQCKFIVFIRTLETLYPERMVCRFFLIIPDFDLISDIRN